MIKKKYRVKKIYTFEDWEYCNLLIKKDFFKNSFYNPFEMDEIRGLFINEKLIGTVSIHINKENAECNYFIISEENRNKGIGSVFIKKIEKYLKYKDIKNINFVAKDRLKNFYLKNKYKLIKHENKHFYFTKKL